ncbi:UPF0547 protein C16orf87 homolog isoform X6 [Amyelois transitella]|uniref:UPF0547 protein C16orf87 homolog isoform X6 n=1 Tax=Amyelois transitella TaxID=680683 RepID=UPI00298F5E9E|nr:UPF0547 protein C16orf87 homolog isoform X6 [Amyelois transitella]
MGKNKMIAKSCPKCEMQKSSFQVAVASKSCKCGHTFFAARRGADSLPAVEDIRRRTGRVRRSQPQFYDAQHYQKQIKRRSPKKRGLDEDYKGNKDKSESEGSEQNDEELGSTVRENNENEGNYLSFNIKDSLWLDNLKEKRGSIILDLLRS